LSVRFGLVVWMHPVGSVEHGAVAAIG
jgi:hypothetical protein